MTETELGRLLSGNIKKYRKGHFTQESLAEKADLSVQLINGIEGGRKWVSRASLAKIAEALGVEVYQLFLPDDTAPVKIKKTPENKKIRAEIQASLIGEIRKKLNKTLDKMEQQE